MSMLSVVIPAYNEANNLANLIPGLIAHLKQADISHEILVVNDNSSDNTEATLKSLMQDYPTLTYVNNAPPNGFGLAVRCGLQAFKGDAVVIVMADGSDSPEDVVRFYKKLQEGYDCVFGSRFMPGGKAVDYPFHKKIINRLANNFVRILFQFRYNDITNAFKCYRRHVIAGLNPLLAHHFNLTVELPLKAIIRGYRYAVIPNAWYNRKEGVSKLKIREMGSRYLFIVLYCLIERLFSRGDYKIVDKSV
ncbi:MAG: glycosyltransferase family 2 protein [Candidatus Berkiella sp.]